MTNKPLCIYHGNCADGFGAAWVVRRYFGKDNVDFHAGVYQDPPPDVSGRDVIIVDFSYKPEVLASMLQSSDIRQANTILLIDHHKSAIDDLYESISPPENTAYDPLYWRMLWESWGQWPVRAVFDMSRSGAGLAWDFFFPHERRPLLINHIEDRDLWKFAIAGTREIQATVFSHPYDFEVWDRLMGADDMQPLVWEGAAIARKHHKDVAELVAVTRRMMKIGGHIVPVANLPYTLTSDAGHLMAADAPFAACYWDTPDGRVFSLRSREDGADVSEIAKQYGGGGHKHASGFRVSFDRLAEFLP